MQIHVSKTHYFRPFWQRQGSICETRKGPNRPPIRMGIDYLVYALVLEIQSYGQFWPTSVGRNCHKAHLYAKTFHMSLFPGLYDHPLQRNSQEKHKFNKEVFVKHEQAPTAPRFEVVFNY